MVILNVELDNIYSFKGFKINFTYKKKIVNNQLGEECFSKYPNFRYKKVNIITGANAAGKTTLGKSIMGILNFVAKKNINCVFDMIGNKEEASSFVIDYYLGKDSVYRVACFIKPNANKMDDMDIQIFNVKLDRNDSYETFVKKLENTIPMTNLLILDNENIGWKFQFPFDTDVVSYDFPESLFGKYENILNKIIVTLDPAIGYVKRSKEMPNCFNVYFKNGMQPLPVENGRSTHDMKRLSSGTKYAFNLAYVYLAVKERLHGFYYVDEQFSYVNNDIEKTFISLLCSMIPQDEQIIFTTHNIDVLDLNLPIHAYGFLKKEDLTITYSNASEVEKKNNVNIKNDYENDKFCVAPKLTEIYKLDA